MRVARELEENFTEAEIEELLVGAKNKDDMFMLGRLDNDDIKRNTRGKKEDEELYVTLENFKALLSSDINDTKIKIPKLKNDN